MGDGISDGYRAAQEAEDERQFYIAVQRFLQEGSAVDQLSMIEGGGLPDKLAEAARRAFKEGGVRALLKNLLARDENVWAAFLLDAKRYDGPFGKLKKLSPFAGKLIILVDYGSGFVTLGGEIEQEIERAIVKRGLCAYDCDKYLVTADLNIDGVFWAGTGAFGPGHDTPVKEEREKAKKARAR